MSWDGQTTQNDLTVSDGREPLRIGKTGNILGRPVSKSGSQKDHAFEGFVYPYVRVKR